MGPLTTELSARELQCLTLIAEGKSNKQIAHALNISPRTAEIYVSALIRKLGVVNRTGVVAMAFRRGLLIDAD
jgi:DNA-binding CsgD family transcriptional regulator